MRDSNGTYFSSGKTNKGLPQGCIFSPLLLNIYISGIIKQISHLTKIIGFADDIIIYISDPDINFIINTLQTELANLDNWLFNLRLKISIPKCSFIIFGDENIKPNNFSGAYKGLNIKNSYTMKYFGVIWDEDLTWESHIH